LKVYGRRQHTQEKIYIYFGFRTEVIGFYPIDFELPEKYCVAEIRVRRYGEGGKVKNKKYSFNRKSQKKMIFTQLLLSSVIFAQNY